jgi:hypothetical protein
MSDLTDDRVLDPDPPSTRDAPPMADDTPRTMPGVFEGEWRTLPNGSRWTDANGNSWRRAKNGRLKIGGSHPGVTGPKPQALRMKARADLNEILALAKKIAKNPKSKARDVLKAIEVLHKVGGMQSVALLNADGDNATLAPVQVVENVIPIPASQAEARAAEERELPALEFESDDDGQ